MKFKSFIEKEYVEKSNYLIKNPKISVILPTYNRADCGLLFRSISSVLNQGYKNFELIIIDDGSIDKTRELIKKIIKEDDRIIYIRNEKNCGIPAIRVNQGMLHSRGVYMSYQFDDDIWYMNMLSELYEFINKHEGISLVYGKAKYIDIKSNTEAILGSNYNKSAIRKNNFIPNNAVLHLSKLPYIYGGYDCNVLLKRLCDWDLWKRWSKHIKIQHVEKILTEITANNRDSIGINNSLNRKEVIANEKRNMCEKLSLYNIYDYEIDI